MTEKILVQEFHRRMSDWLRSRPPQYLKFIHGDNEQQKMVQVDAVSFIGVISHWQIVIDDSMRIRRMALFYNQDYLAQLYDGKISMRIGANNVTYFCVLSQPRQKFTYRLYPPQTLVQTERIIVFQIALHFDADGNLCYETATTCKNVTSNEKTTQIADSGCFKKQFTEEERILMDEFKNPAPSLLY